MSSHSISIHNLPNAAIILSQTGVIIEVNNCFADTLGFAPTDLAGKSVNAIAVEGEAQIITDAISLTVKNKTHKTESILQSKFGDSYTFELYLSCIEVNSCEAILVQALNVTHYKRVKDELNEQRRFHKTLINSLPGMVYRCKNDKNWTMEYVSHYCTIITGYKPSELVANQKISFREIIHPNHRDRLWNKWQEVIKDKDIFIDEYPIISADGSEKWVREQGVGVFDNNDKLITLEGIILDITQQKKYQEALQQSESRFRLIIENMPILLNAFDENGDIIIWNKACEESTGYSADEIIRNPTAFEMLYPDPEYRQHVWNASLDHSNKNNVYDLVSKDGEKRTISWFDTYHFVSLPGWATWGIGLDITDQQKAVEALRDSEEKFRMLVENAFDGIYLMRNRHYEYVNQRFIDITGYTLDELSSETFDFNMLLTPLSKELVEQRYKDRELGKEISNQYEIQIVSKDGTKREVEVSTSSLGVKGNVLVLGTMRDISDRKQSQRLLLENKEKLKLQNEEYLALNEELTETNKRIKQINADLLSANLKAEENDKLKSAFLANMSHEVRTPMNGILGFSQLLLNTDLDTTEREEFVGIIQNCGNQLLAIINDLIDISKIEANQIMLSPSKINLNQILNEQFLLYKSKADSQKLSLSCSTSLSNDDSYIIADGNRLRQIISNLLGNALKFTKKGFVKFGYRVNDDFVVFFIADSGIGVTKDKQGFIFERFRQVETDLSRQFGGTGLGLAISKALTIKMGGKIWVESEPNLGSTFYFSIPYNKAIVEPIDSDKSEPRYQNIQSKPHILIADDNEVNYMYLKELLKDIDALLAWACNGKEAVEMVRQNPNITLVLMDIKMPIMDGYEATREVKKIRKDLPVIAQTAYAMSSDREKATQAGCDEYISKPINKEKFIAIISRFLKSAI